MMMIAWGLIFCFIILSHHITSNESNKAILEMEKALYSPVEEDTAEDSQTLMEELDISVGRRQTLLGILSVLALLVLHNQPPFYEYWANIVAGVLNGVVISAMAGYTIEGLLIWNSPVKVSTEVEEG